MATFLGGGLAIDMHNANVGSIMTDADSVERYPGGWYFIKGSGLATEANDSFIGHEFIYDESNNLVSGVVETWIHDIYVPGDGVMGWTIDGASASGHPVTIALLGNDAQMLFEQFLSGNDAITGSEFGDVLDGFYGYDDIFAGRGNDHVFGGLGRDLLEGENGNDELNGGDGRDRLTGGLGADAFVFDSKLRAGNADRITDFNPDRDIFHLKADAFPGMEAGVIAENAFTLGTAASDPNDRFIYDQGQGQLFFDSDGTGIREQKLFATVDPGTAVQFVDILMV